MKLHLGCGRDKWDGFINLDCTEAVSPDVVHNLDIFPLPFADNTFDTIVALHLLEHLLVPYRTVEELYRIAKPDALFYFAVPYGSSDNAWEDPTHRHAFFYHTSFYYSQAAYARADYGYRGDWVLERRYLFLNPSLRGLPEHDALARIAQLRNMVKEMWCVLRANKPCRVPPVVDKEPITKLLYGNETRDALLYEVQKR